MLGPSGAGKTTLMRVLAGFERPSAGLGVVDGLDVGARRRRVARHRATTLGYADQHYWRALADDLTAEELVAVPLGLQGARERSVWCARGRCSSGSASATVPMRIRASSRAASSSGSRSAQRLAHRPRC